MKPLTDKELRMLAHEVYRTYYENSESFTDFGLGSNVAYLLGAILGHEQPGYTFLDDPDQNEQHFLDLTRELFDPYHPVWQFIEIMPKGEDAEDGLMPHPEHTLKMIVAGTDAMGTPDMFFCKLKTTEEEVEEGLHYERAKVIAKDNGYGGPFVVWDEDDAPQVLLNLFVWESAETYPLQPKENR